MRVPLEWPALAIQTILLSTNVACILSGQRPDYLLHFTLSTGIVVLVYGFQLIHEGFLLPFPVRTIPMIKRTIPTRSLDTWILRIAVYIAFSLMLWGLTQSYLAPILVTLVVILLFCVW